MWKIKELVLYAVWRYGITRHTSPMHMDVIDAENQMYAMAAYTMCRWMAIGWRSGVTIARYAMTAMKS